MSLTTTWPWVQLFVRQFELCDARPDENVVVLTEPVTAPALVETIELALQHLGCRVTRLVLPPDRRCVDRLEANPVAVAALVAADLVIDCSRHGIVTSKALTRVLESQSRVLVVDGRHPEELEHVVPHPGLARRVEHAVELLRGVELKVFTPAGTSLRLGLRGAEVSGESGVVDRPGTIGHWPAGSVRVVPRSESAWGTIVLMPGDMIASAQARVRSPVTLVVEHDHICDIQGDSGDADLVRSCLEAFDDTASYGIASLGWGMALTADSERWASMGPVPAPHDAGLAAGMVSIRSGANPVAGRDAPGGVTLCLRHCTVSVDGIDIIRNGQLEGGLAPDVYEQAARG